MSNTRSRSLGAVNATFAFSVGWGGRIPAHFTAAHPGLLAAPDSEDFAAAVRAVQVELFPQEPREWDGALGTRTWQAMLTAASAGGVTHRKHHAPIATPTTLLDFDTYATSELNLQRLGDFTRRPARPLRRIVLHWGGYDRPSCFRALANQNLSSHYGVDHAGITQWCDLEVDAWHAGPAGNPDSIGVDICQQVVGGNVYARTNYPDAALRQMRMAPNTSGRGEKQCYMLDARTAARTRALVLELCDIFEIPRTWPGHHQVVPTAQRGHGVMGHHHLAKTKWDIAPWWDAIFRPGDLES